MKIQVNGELVEGNGVANISALVERLGFQPQTVLIEHNGLALHRSEWAGHGLVDGDRVEVIRIVAGG